MGVDEDTKDVLDGMSEYDRAMFGMYALAFLAFASGAKPKYTLDEVAMANVIQMEQQIALEQARNAKVQDIDEIIKREARKPASFSFRECQKWHQTRFQ